eukprot:TRINITY_DN7425_c0_g1_i5.p1 TRINITY_DN7425_c0_g1~~TRINITY_DN7425_c0_g1_i5.p1  ORF type:complete len:125 (+),score=15.91 TRINITY_DN7425_c0_g1_i5:95-469(+)
MQAMTGSEKGEVQEQGTALQRHWRRVASTHSLQDLLDENESESVEFDLRSLLSIVLLMLFLLIWCIYEISALMVLKLLPRARHPVILTIQEDEYYCLLIPLLIPVTITAVILNWFSLKIFKHNS